MIVLANIDELKPEGRYTAILPEILTEQPETEFGHYVFDGIGRFHKSENGSIGLADVITKINLRFCDLTSQDLHHNIENFKNIEQLNNVYKGMAGFDERMIVTLIDFDYKPFE